MFQRTPSSIDERNNTETNEDWFLNQSPGWQAKRRENFEGFLTGNVSGKDLVNDGWTEVFRRILGAMLNNGPSRFRIFLWTLGSVFSRKLYTEGLRSYLQGKFMSHVGVKNLAKQVEMADFEKMEQIRARADSVVNDPETAESLKPYYRQFCKRPCFNDEYLSAFNNDNVELVDTDLSLIHI